MKNKALFLIIPYMKFELNRPTDYSDEAIINEIKRCSLVVEKPLTTTKFDNNSKYSAATIAQRFGGWLKALEKAGLDSSYCHLANKRISKEDIINELKRVSAMLGTTCFSQKEFTSNCQISRNVFSKRNGTFNLLMKEAVFTTPLSSRKYTDEERFENLLNVWTHYGRQPTYAEMKKEPSIVGPKAYVVRWGSWTKALLAFIEKVNSDISEQPMIETEFSKNDYSEPLILNKGTSSSEDKRDISVGLRFNIFKRDRYKCVICGRSPATTFGLELHADHKIPFTKGGKTREDNLRTLCNECNIGKSNKFD